jgi:hypothetical protein
MRRRRTPAYVWPLQSTERQRLDSTGNINSPSMED